MDSTDDMAAERAELKALRARLRARAEHMVACVEALDDPETLSDAWRSVRLIRQADAMVCQLYAAPESVVRPHVPRLDAPRLARHSSRPDDYEATDVQNESMQLEAARDELGDRVDRMIRVFAGDNGFWPNGTAFDADDPDWRSHAEEVIPDSAPGPDDEPTTFEIARRVNAMARHTARHKGKWPDGSRFDEADPDYFAISHRFGKASPKTPPVSLPPGVTERHEARGIPWWLIHRVLSDDPPEPETPPPR